MLLKILGSGTCVPSLKRSSPANYLKIGDKQILVDCGSGALVQLVKGGLDYKEIDIVCVSHYHPDHISDIICLIQALNWTPGFDRKKDLTLVGPVGFKKFFDDCIVSISGDPRPDTYKIVVKEIENELNFENFSIQNYETNHNEDSIAYKFIEGEKSIVISGDTDFDEGLAEFAKGCDVLVLECSFDNEHKDEGHLIPKECGEIAKKANTKNLILTHFYPGPEEVKLKQAKEIFDNTILAEDLMDFEI